MGTGIGRVIKEKIYETEYLDIMYNFLMYSILSKPYKIFWITKEDI